MTITRAEFGSNLRDARRDQKLEVAQVAAALEMSASDVDLIEEGKLHIGSRDFERFVDLYDRPHAWYVTPTAPALRPTQSAYRTIGLREDRATFDSDLRKCFKIYQQITALKRMIGIGAARRISYGRGAPHSLKQAIAQGLRAARKERERLGLADEPITDVGALVALEGIDVVSTRMPEDISGLMLAQEGEDAFIVVNEDDHALRRNFSIAHEYAHVLFDRAEAGIVTQTGEAHTLRERRANAFARAFLVPDAGVRAYLNSVGKQRSAPFGSYGTIEPVDVAALGARFRTSGKVIAYKLQRMKVVREEAQVLRLIRETEGKVELPGFDHSAARESGRRRLSELAETAYRKWKISEGKLREILALALDAEAVERKATEIEESAGADMEEDRL